MTGKRIIDLVETSGMPNEVHLAKSKGKQMGISHFLMYSQEPQEPI